MEPESHTHLTQWLLVAVAVVSSAVAVASLWLKHSLSRPRFTLEIEPRFLYTAADGSPGNLPGSKGTPEQRTLFLHVSNTGDVPVRVLTPETNMPVIQFVVDLGRTSGKLSMSEVLTVEPGEIETRQMKVTLEHASEEGSYLTLRFGRAQDVRISGDELKRCITTAESWHHRKQA